MMTGSFVENGGTGLRVAVAAQIRVFRQRFQPLRRRPTYRFQLHKRRQRSWRRSRIKTRWIKLIANMSEVNIRLKALGQIFRRLDCSDRISEKSIGTKNLTNRKSFHEFSIDAAPGGAQHCL